MISTKPETNCERVLRLLITMGKQGVTAHHMELGKGFRLASRIWDLQQDGHEIEPEYRADKVCVYRLVRECPDVEAFKTRVKSERYFTGVESFGATC